MKCDNVDFGGWGSCAALLEMMNGGALHYKGVNPTDAQVISLPYWRTAIADDDRTVRNTLMLPVLSFENTTDDVEVLTSPLGKKSIGTKPTPSGIIYLDGSICDYNHIHALEDTWYEFTPFFQGNKFWQTRKSDGTLKGFRCKIGTKAGMPPEDKNQSYPVYIFFDEYEEFETIVQVSPDFKYSDLYDYSPAGLEVKITSDYSAGDIAFKVVKRGSGDPMITLVVGSFIITKSNATPTVVVTAIDDSGAELGDYIVTIKKDNDGTPTNLDETDWVQMVIQFSDGTYATFMASAFKFNGGA